MPNIRDIVVPYVRLACLLYTVSSALWTIVHKAQIHTPGYHWRLALRYVHEYLSMLTVHRFHSVINHHLHNLRPFSWRLVEVRHTEVWFNYEQQLQHLYTLAHPWLTLIRALPWLTLLSKPHSDNIFIHWLSITLSNVGHLNYHSRSDRHFQHRTPKVLFRTHPNRNTSMT